MTAAGRPPIGPIVNIRMPEALIAQLDVAAAQSGQTRATLIREWLTERLEQGA